MDIFEWLKDKIRELDNNPGHPDLTEMILSSLVSEIESQHKRIEELENGVDHGKIIVDDSNALIKRQKNVTKSIDVTWMG